jgi:predicted nucleic acid-binding protein
MPTRVRAVVDASCILRALLTAAEDAQRWLDDIATEVVDASAPDLIHAEVAHGLVRQVRARRIRVGLAAPMLQTVLLLPIRLASSRLLAAPACALALDRGLTAYDAHYLALAEAEDAVLVTADRTLAAAASRSVLLE